MKKKAAKAKAAPAAEVKPEETVLILRTCNPDMTSRNGFKYPESGPVECPDWNPKPECGNGLHGLLNAIGDYGLLDCEDPMKLWQVIRVKKSEVVAIGDDKVKFPRGEVIYTGIQAKAMDYFRPVWRAMAEAPSEASGGYCAPASTAGYCAPASTAGYCAPASTAGDRAPASTAGDRAPASTAGDRAPASTAGYCAPASTAGDRAPASTAGDCAPASTAGKCSPAACLGTEGKARAGERGSVLLTYWEGDGETGRPRHVIGYVGEGIEANTWYELHPETHELRKVAS